MYFVKVCYKYYTVLAVLIFKKVPTVMCMKWTIWPLTFFFNIILYGKILWVENCWKTVWPQATVSANIHVYIIYSYTFKHIQTKCWYNIYLQLLFMKMNVFMQITSYGIADVCHITEEMIIVCFQKEILDVCDIDLYHVNNNLDCV